MIRMAFGPNPVIVEYLTRRYGPGLVNDTVRVEVHSTPNDIETMVITVLVHRVSLRKREGRRGERIVAARTT